MKVTDGLVCEGFQQTGFDVRLKLPIPRVSVEL
jgi:hypothetical protein